MKCLLPFAVLLIAIVSPPSVRAEKVGPWDLDVLYQAPAMHWVKQEGPVHALLYAGEAFAGKPTEVFAFYASPATLGAAEAKARGEGKGGVQAAVKFPGVVLIHGGGGTAFAEWAYLWAKRGYAAIAMDLSGRRPPDPVFDPKTGAPMGHQSDGKLRTRLPNGGPEHGSAEKFECIGGATDDDWPFHAAASAIRAHSLLRSFAEVDAEHTAVTGISWGGYTTCLVASLDARFQAAVPVYGCGFLFEGDSVQKASIDKLGERRQQWIRAYDPSSLLARCRIPILFVNGTNDLHYPLDSYQKSFELVPDARKQMRIELGMVHGHAPGWAPREIGLFIDSYCRGGEALPVPEKPEIQGNEVRVSFRSAVPVKAAQLHYTTDAGARAKRAWKSSAAVVTNEGGAGSAHRGVITATKPPAEANTWYVSLTDERGAMVSTPVQFQVQATKGAQ